MSGEETVRLVSPWLELWRAAVLGCGAFVLGLGTYLLWAYVRQHLTPQRPYAVRAHVISIIVSYVLLVAGLEFYILARAVQRSPITWRLPLASVAFPLGAFALLTLVSHRAKKPHDKED